MRGAARGIWYAGWFTAGVALAAAVIGMLGVRLWTEPADAAPPACIADGDYGQIGAIEDPGASVSNNSRGTISSMLVASGPTPCQRISSIYVQTAQGGSFEFGWVIGYSNCTDRTYSAPTMFCWARNNDGSRRCGVWGARPLAQGQWDTFRVSDTDANTYWGSYINGESLQPAGVNMDFSQGYSITAMERGASTDSGRARWHNLSEYHDGNGWSSWDNAALGRDADPDYFLQRLSANDVDSTHI